MERWQTLWERYRRALIIGMVGVVAGVLYVAQQTQSAHVSIPVPSQTPVPGDLIVDVEGAVHAPGLHRLPAGALVEDAIVAAGNLAPQADLVQIARQLNRAEKLKPNQKLYLPFLGEVTAKAGGTSAQSGESATTSDVAGGPVNLNSATQEELETLPGVGPATAEKIVQYREEHGGFQNSSELMDISGIGEKTFEKLKDLVST